MDDLAKRIYLDAIERIASLNPFTSDDKNLVVSADEYIRKHFDKGYHQLASAALTREREIIYGLQFDSKIAQHSQCAEFDLIVNVAEKLQVGLIAIVTVRADGSLGLIQRTHVVYPCARFLEVARQCQPFLKFIVPSGSDDPKWISALEADNLVKLPVDILYPQVYAERKRSRPPQDLLELEKQWVQDNRR
jgi:cytidine deaminase